MNPDFLLIHPLAQQLYHSCAAQLPIIDYHNHLDAAAIAQNRRYENITQLWVASDPYKHRAMRILGVPEEKITGSASDYKKFCVWYESLPQLVGNPLFDWSVMELKQIFAFDLLPFKPRKEVWEQLNNSLQTMTTADILGKFKIEYSAPCAALTDDLSCFDGKTLCPSLRGDDLLLPEKALLQKLGDPQTLCDYLAAIWKKLSDFYDAGCRFADHALDNGFAYIPDDGKNESRFTALLEGALPDSEKAALKSYILKHLTSFYAELALTMQLHMGAQRTTSTRLRSLAGKAGGYAAIGNSVDIASLCTFLDDVESASGLPNVLLFSLNPVDNAALATLCGSYSADGRQALISQGPAWWWCDHYTGITAMLENFASHSVLSTFVGMTTDSRSVLSFVRHDYFRRVLCQWLANMVSAHRLPEDMDILQDIVTRMCYTNAKTRIGG